MELFNNPTVVFLHRARIRTSKNESFMNQRYISFNYISKSVLLALCPFALNAQIITTVAGNGQYGSTGDKDYAAYATLNTPAGLAADGRGNLYISDQMNNKIRKIDAYGVMTTIAGHGSAGISGDGGPASAAKVSWPGDMTLDKYGNLYFADCANHRIRKIDTAGIISTVAGNGVPGFAGDSAMATDARLNNPKGVALDDEGNIYIADQLNNRIRKVTTQGYIFTVAGGGDTAFLDGGVNAFRVKLNHPYGVAVAKDGSIYIGDTYNNVIRKVGTDSMVTKIAGSSTGLGGYGGDNGGAWDSRVSHPVSFKLDRKGDLYFADMENNRVRKLEMATGIMRPIAGNGSSGSAQNGDGGPALDAQIYRPTAIALDSADNVYVAEGTNRVRYVYLAAPFKSSTITIFPNPCDKNTNIFLPSVYEEIAHIFVVDAAGRRVTEMVGPTNKYINVPFNATGYYTIQAATKHDEWSGRVMVVWP